MKKSLLAFLLGAVLSAAFTYMNVSASPVVYEQQAVTVQRTRMSAKSWNASARPTGWKARTSVPASSWSFPYAALRRTIKRPHSRSMWLYGKDNRPPRAVFSLCNALRHREGVRCRVEIRLAG